MTDNEIIRALDDLIHLGDAPIMKGFGVIIDKQTLKDTLDLINRLKAENERLKKQNQELKRKGQKAIEEIQSKVEDIESRTKIAVALIKLAEGE